jgi:hypothetical protein
MEEQKQITLSDLNLVQLKAIAYDEIIKLNVSQNNLRVLNQELSNRQQQGVEGAQRYIQTKIVDQAGRDDQAAVDMQIAWAQEETTHEPWMDEYTIPTPKVAASSQQTKMPTIDGGTGAWATPALASAEGW